MPASRSRTQEWKRCLAPVQQRGGGLEIAIAPPEGSTQRAADLVWRVRVMALEEGAIEVESPMALGRPIELDPGVTLVAVLVIGQNRWMFRTTNIGRGSRLVNGAPTIRLAMPPTVERCQRRNHYRVETAAIDLPEVEVWPLLDPASVVVAERANELAIDAGEAVEASAEGAEIALPSVGPKITALLNNIGGGGAGLMLDSHAASALGHHRLVWIRLRLPGIQPVCTSARVVHTHLDSAQRTYAGLAFDFTFNPVHQRYVLGQIAKYIALRQREQLRAAG